MNIIGLLIIELLILVTKKEERYLGVSNVDNF